MSPRNASGPDENPAAVTEVPTTQPVVVESTPETSRRSSTSTSTTTTTSAPPPAPTAAPTSAPPSGDAAALLSQVRVADELDDAGYDRGLFDHWTDADDDSCDTRCEVLEAELRPDGTWLSLYDNITTSNPSEFDVDHVVALAEAWRSGAANWDGSRREAFANDLDEPRSLIAVSASSNRSKSDKDPSEWRPPERGYWCQYVTDWMVVKLRWDLAVDRIEFTAPQSLVQDC